MISNLKDLGQFVQRDSNNLTKIQGDLKWKQKNTLMKLFL
ncbi:hypothetical protein XBP1_650038 [Xenorhabdus bovienii str. puntauvense]|uniref:Uncharacterized protein n=1 Tax=Xenorhabdus bovienii str. puntauvense TaxID=1398201 RepID=A0A077NA07_XENBV|nr:hypothetical protein XBP1_650038 [Xenorhabdus bovienii str. puntauvense]